ncbi:MULTISPECIES: XRE family transcriptional regulator [Burkholderia]|jgi:Zn-dependent peptidase ImmA (M78 family)|uniref:XRE family transcriptional regulator n=3 Tax=Burkholderia cenocepacia TaxID=95486 RepID=A0A9Q5MH73_9BURK|nr:MULTISPECIES: XRE family transcriptional regulator [Burkholderia]AIO45892.1 helix-turn-helix family protein [Burkholderia cepacia]ALV60337.1 DNA-binding protein [Burkholderia cenocepacia]AMU13027.1 DNA-binding protein [Burkholderia cenocepacia]AQQ21525.1 DNA-binding protein [Burkholderia cenocepacia]AQQ47258.1 DNA-binding protein [Burkholderia cenocepacia]
MKREPVEGVQPEVLRWARETVGLSIDEVATMLRAAPSEVADWETGAGAPTYAQLEKLAYQVFKRPLAVFFLPAPPEEKVPQREFRTLPETDMRSLARDTYLQIRQAHAFQLSLKEVFNGRNPADKLIWKSLALSLSEPVSAQADKVRRLLGITLDEQTSWRNDDLALKQWRKAIEDAGVFVFKSSFKQREISGFCLMDEAFPIIYLNNSTTKTRQIFSLLHELAHLLLSMNGLSKLDSGYIDALPKAEREIERFCNAIAAEVLIPPSAFDRLVAGHPSDVESAPDEMFAELASYFGVSREAVLRRLLDQGRVSQAFYKRKATIWSAQQREAKGGSYYANQGAYLSDRFAREVVGRHYRHQITLEQAADFLGIKPKSFAGFEEHVLHGAGA